MMINNSPEFYVLWWACFKIGAVPAPINTSITQEPFRHCLKISESTFLFCSYELYGGVAASLALDSNGASSNSGGFSPGLMSNIYIYDYSSYPPCPVSDNVRILKHNNLEPVKASMAAWPKESRPKIAGTDVSQYLFTSGTTGLPKAATWPAAYSVCILST
jgi:fatty-acyl-CoA synthase